MFAHFLQMSENSFMTEKNTTIRVKHPIRFDPGREVSLLTGLVAWTVPTITTP